MIAALILTKNESLHIARCIRHAQQVCKEIWVVDSYSTDDTCKIATDMGAHVVQHPFVNLATQFNWAIEHLPIQAEWIWRFDADEIMEPGLAALARNVDTLPPTVNGIYVNRKIIFMGHALKYGGWYPAPHIKVIRKGYGRSESKIIDEHLVITSGETAYWNGDQTDWNLNSVDWWWQKHIGYAQVEAVNTYLSICTGNMEGGGVKPSFWGTDAERKRWLKLRYAKLPLFVRPILYFLSRYILLGGFLDGRAGWHWHTKQGLRYRWMVDKNLKRLDLLVKQNCPDRKFSYHLEDADMLLKMLRKEEK